MYDAMSPSRNLWNKIKKTILNVLFLHVMVAPFAFKISQTWRMCKNGPWASFGSRSELNPGAFCRH